jgi:hypothetical protein
VGGAAHQRPCTDGAAFVSSSPGIFGTGAILAYRGPIEAQGRQMLHPHVLVWLTCQRTRARWEGLEGAELQRALRAWNDASVAAAAAVESHAVETVAAACGIAHEPPAEDDACAATAGLCEVRPTDQSAHAVLRAVPFTADHKRRTKWDGEPEPAGKHGGQPVQCEPDAAGRRVTGKCARCLKEIDGNRPDRTCQCPEALRDPEECRCRPAKPWFEVRDAEEDDAVRAAREEGRYYDMPRTGQTISRLPKYRQRGVFGDAAAGPPATAVPAEVGPSCGDTRAAVDVSKSNAARAST